jgi:hypothetical protein
MGEDKILDVDSLFFISQWKNNSSVKRIPIKVQVRISLKKIVSLILAFREIGNLSYPEWIISHFAESMPFRDPKEKSQAFAEWNQF